MPLDCRHNQFRKSIPPAGCKTPKPEILTRPYVRVFRAMTRYGVVFGLEHLLHPQIELNLLLLQWMKSREDLTKLNYCPNYFFLL